MKDKGIGRETDEFNKYQKLAPKKETPSNVQTEGREHQNGLQQWRKGATHQLSNWTFPPSEVTVELFKKNSSAKSSQYKIKPYRKNDPYSGFVFT